MNPTKCPKTSSLPAFKHLRVSVEGRCALLEFRHGRVNEMGRAQVNEIERLVECLENSSFEALVSFSRRRTRAGRSVFVAGADVTERKSWTDQDTLEHLEWQRSVLRRLGRLPQLVIAVVDGLAAGWGLEWLLACDYVIAGPGASFSLPETGLGIVPGAGATATLASRVGIGHALRLGMTGEPIESEEALRIGLIHECAVDLAEGMRRARALVARRERRSPVAVAAFKSVVVESLEKSRDELDYLEQQAYGRCLESGHAAAGRQAFETILRGEPVEWPEENPDALVPPEDQ